MPNLKKITENLETISTFSTVSSVYESIAQLRMNRIRGEVLRTRHFLDGLVRVYGLAKKSYLGPSKKKGGFAAPKNKETLVIYLSSNEFLSGSLIIELWQSVKKYLWEKVIHLVVVGKMGKYLAESEGYGDKLFYFPLDDEKPSKQDIKELIDFIQKYERVVVFHGRFESVINQQAVRTDISGGSYVKGEAAGEIMNYLFEPSPEKVLEFFENEIRVALFNQVLLEHRLARHAARLISMHETTEKAKEAKKTLERGRKKIERYLADKEQIEFFGNFNLWKKEKTTI